MSWVTTHRTTFMKIGCVFAVLSCWNALNAQEVALYDNTGIPGAASLPIINAGALEFKAAQQFFTNEFGNVVSVSIDTFKTGTPRGQMTVEIWDDNGSGTPGKSVAVVGSIAYNTFSTSWGLVTVHGLVAGLTPHTPYFVVLDQPVEGLSGGNTYHNRWLSGAERIQTLGNPPAHFQWRRDFVAWVTLNQTMGTSSIYNYLSMKVTSAIPKTSHTPEPADGTTDVYWDAVLSWQPGKSVSSVDGHIVYFSENFDDVNDGIGGITLSAESYDPRRLDLGQTYYWRVDEVNGPPDFTVFEGKVWSFTTEPVAYPIENITATASGAIAFSVPENTVIGSGLVDDLHGTSPADMWISEGIPAHIEYAFDRAYKLHEMWIWNSNQSAESSFGFGAKDVVIEHSLDGTDWRVLDGVPEL